MKKDGTLNTVEYYSIVKKKLNLQENRWSYKQSP